jgi:hypothetical protein
LTGRLGRCLFAMLAVVLFLSLSCSCVPVTTTWPFTTSVPTTMVPTTVVPPVCLQITERLDRIKIDKVSQRIISLARSIAGEGLFEGLNGAKVSEYGIHMGQTENPGHSSAFQVTQTPQGEAGYFDGATNQYCLVFGTFTGYFTTMISAADYWTGCKEDAIPPLALRQSN